MSDRVAPMCVLFKLLWTAGACSSKNFPAQAMAAAVSVSAAARDEKPYVGPNCGSRPLTLYENYGTVVAQDEWVVGEKRDPDVESTDETASTGNECQRRADDELPVLSPEEIESRLERTRKEFYNRRKIIIKNLPSDITNQVSILSAF